MREQIDHERCAELLGPLVNGELEPDLTSDVEAHLQGCPQCSLERAGLAALLAGEVPALTELERGRMRRVVLSEAVPVPSEDPTMPVSVGRGPSPGARLYQVLGAAAVLAVIGGFAYLGLGGGMAGQDSGAGGADTATEAGGSSEEANAPVGDRLRRSQFNQKAERSKAADATAGGTQELQAGAGPAAPPPTFDTDLGLVGERRLRKLGESGLPLVVFSRAYTTADIDEYQTNFIDEVADQAPEVRGEDIRSCAGSLTEQFPNSLLAYAALAEFKNRGDILVLAFAWTDEESGPLDQSMVWAWSIGDCDGIPAYYSKNVIRPRR